MTYFLMPFSSSEKSRAKALFCMTFKPKVMQNVFFARLPLPHVNLDFNYQENLKKTVIIKIRSGKHVQSCLFVRFSRFFESHAKALLRMTYFQIP